MVKLSEKVYEYMKEMILKQEIKCGENIPEERIAKILNVSRTPIREAIQRLSQDGIIILKSHSFAKVIEFSQESINNLGIIRITLDALAIQIAIHYGSNEDFNRLYPIAEKCLEASEKGDAYNWIKNEYKFHLSLVKIGKNEDLLRILNSIYTKVRLLMVTQFKDIKKNSGMVKIHYDIIDALKERNVKKSLDLMQKHLGHFYNLSPLECSLNVKLNPRFWLNKNSK